MHYSPAGKAYQGLIYSMIKIRKIVRVMKASLSTCNKMALLTAIPFYNKALAEDCHSCYQRIVLCAFLHFKV
jgi:hypothetical protein